MFEMSLEELFAAADALPDHRSEVERAEVERQIQEALDELAEAVYSS